MFGVTHPRWIDHGLIRKMNVLLTACGVISLCCLSVALPTPSKVSHQCKDHFQNCTYLSLTGACAKYSAWMAVHCGVSCNSCQGTPTFSVCKDRRKYCSYWAYAGECKKSSAYMLVNCKYSCNICGGKYYMRTFPSSM